MSKQINIKLAPGGEKFSLQVDSKDESMTVAQFKELVEQQTSVPATQQRLIYKGHVLRDARTFESYGVEDGHTVLLVRGRRAADKPAETGAAPAMPAEEGETTAASSGTGAAGTGTTASGVPAGMAQDPFAAMMGGMGSMGIGGMGGMGAMGMPGMGGLPPGAMGNPAAMQQYLMQNPEAMRQMMDSPIMQYFMENPELIRQMMMANPQMRQVLESNPQLGSVLNNPQMLRQSLQMVRNPGLMQEMMRNMDTQMRNIESHPGGFNALRRNYEEVQAPLLDAMQNPLGASNTGGGGSGAATAPSSAAPNTEALPNPWAAPAPASNTNTGAGSTPGSAPNPFAAMFAGGMGHPAMGGIGGIGGMGMGNPAMAQMMQNPQMMAQMMQNPMVQQMMGNLAENPALMQQMLQANPMTRQMVNTNPMMASLLQNPEYLRAIMNPENMARMAQSAQGMPGMGMPGMGMGMPQASASAGAPPPVMFNPLFAGFMPVPNPTAGTSAAGAAGGSTTAGATIAPQQDTSVTAGTQSTVTSSSGSSVPSASAAADPANPWAAFMAPPSSTGAATSTPPVTRASATPAQQQSTTPAQQPADPFAALAAMMAQQQAAADVGARQAPNPFAAMFGQPPPPTAGQQGSAPAGAAAAGGPAMNPAFWNMFMPQIQPPGAGATAGASQQQQTPAIIYRDQLNRLQEMGFTNAEANLAALVATGGNVEAAINRLLS
eukprot:gb/GEZN01001658.1/.p1 GENE.gb/GEZN01001658.1/~~gb/GEZN01001658.1/.p1  ORF type:complete len:717 (+),score=134.35 gb/GEZN01001658.1/:48-2198(+)